MFAAAVTALAPPGHCHMVYQERNYKPPKGKSLGTGRCMRRATSERMNPTLSDFG